MNVAGDGAGPSNRPVIDSHECRNLAHKVENTARATAEVQGTTALQKHS
jgi:hypothetical protein